MRAAVLYGKEDVRIEQITPPPLKEGEVRIQIEAALTCGTDLKVFKRGYHARMIVPPAVFGHELAGVVCETRADTANEHGWRTGERVVVANSAPCGACFYCGHKQENLCDDLLFLNGAYAESIVVPARIVEKNLLRLKESTTFRDAALVEPLACVVQGVDETRLQSGQNVLILGAGPIGLMFAALADHLGCSVSIAGRQSRRLDMARKLGAEQVIDVGNGDHLTETIRNAANRRFDVVIEAIGKPETWQSAVHLVRKGGTVNFFGGCPSGTSVSLDTGLLHYSNLNLLASFHHTPQTMRKALDFIERRIIQAADFVDGESTLSELPGLFQKMATGNHAVKSLIDVRR